MVRMRSFHNPLREKPSVNVVKMELVLYCFPSDTFHTSGFLGQDTGCRNPSLCSVWPWLISLDVQMVIYDPGLNGTPSFSNVNLYTHSANAINAKLFQVKVILDRLNKTGDIPRQKFYSFDVSVLIQTKQSKKWQEGQ
jgi:hypothetical protein